MRTMMLSVSIVIILGLGGLTYSFGGDAMSKKDAKPDLKERLTKDAIKGTLVRTDGDYYLIRDKDGKEVRVHVDISTKMDKVMPGDRVKAYLTEKGHATTLQRLEK